VKQADLHRAATNEMIEAARFYEQRREGLGFRFVRVVEEICAKIGEAPDIGSPAEGVERKRRVPRFPFDVVYRTHGAGILVLAIKHHRRKPGYWKWQRYRP
jgi:toxin ParE1/3/4